MRPGQVSILYIELKIKQITSCLSRSVESSVFMKTLWPVGRLEVAQKCNDVLALSVVNHEGLIAAARQLRQKELGRRIFWPGLASF
jgi:hypothetical protein